MDLYLVLCPLFLALTLLSLLTLKFALRFSMSPSEQQEKGKVQILNTQNPQSQSIQQSANPKICKKTAKSCSSALIFLLKSCTIAQFIFYNYSRPKLPLFLGLALISLCSFYYPFWFVYSPIGILISGIYLLLSIKFAKKQSNQKLIPSTTILDLIFGVLSIAIFGFLCGSSYKNYYNSMLIQVIFSIGVNFLLDNIILKPVFLLIFSYPLSQWDQFQIFASLTEASQVKIDTKVVQTSIQDEHSIPNNITCITRQPLAEATNKSKLFKQMLYQLTDENQDHHARENEQTLDNLIGQLTEMHTRRHPLSARTNLRTTPKSNNQSANISSDKNLSSNQPLGPIKIRGRKGSCIQPQLSEDYPLRPISPKLNKTNYVIKQQEISKSQLTPEKPFKQKCQNFLKTIEKKSGRQQTPLKIKEQQNIKIIDDQKQNSFYEARSNTTEAKENRRQQKKRRVFKDLQNQPKQFDNFKGATEIEDLWQEPRNNLPESRQVHPRRKLSIQNGDAYGKFTTGQPHLEYLPNLLCENQTRKSQIGLVSPNS